MVEVFNAGRQNIISGVCFVPKSSKPMGQELLTIAFSTKSKKIWCPFEVDQLCKISYALYFYAWSYLYLYIYKRV